MAAQYRPYRDEDGIENEQMDWGDQEAGTVQIYEKTSSNRVISNRNLVIGGVGVALLGALMGLLVGYFAHSEHINCKPNLAVALYSIKDEDPSIRSKILALVDPKNIKANLRMFSDTPHVAGSQADQELTLYIKSLWETQKLENVKKVTYDVLLSLPNASSPNKVNIVNEDGSVFFSSNISFEKHGDSLYVAYSPNGNVTGDLVYCQNCLEDNLRFLQESKNINLSEKILIAQIKPGQLVDQIKTVQKYNVAGLLLYPDPKLYNPPSLGGKSHSDTLWLPSNGIPDFSLLQNSVGDLLPLGYPATETAYRIEQEQLKLPKVLIQTLSYGDAYHIISSLAGEEAPESWQGGFNFTYRLGPGFLNNKTKLYMEVNNQQEKKKISNVLGYIMGKVEPDRYVLIGNQRDAWIRGVVDASGGTAVLMELSRVFGQLLQEGWRPRRTIVFCSWGAEEFNMIGSTEWIEENLKILQNRAVAYINVGIVVTGNSSISVTASPLLYHAIYNSTKEVPNPNEEEKEVGIETVYEKWKKTFPVSRNISFPLYHLLFAKEQHGKLGILENYVSSVKLMVRPRIKKFDTRGGYLPFVTRAGISAVDVSYVQDVMPVSYPLIHSKYDMLDVVENIIDPTFKYHATVTKVLGELLRDLADSLFLPFNLLEYAEFLSDCSISLRKISANMENKEFQKRYIRYLDTLDMVIEKFGEAAYKFHISQEHLDLSDPMAIRRINDQLLLLERAFLDSRGLPRNFFKKHLVLSPSEAEIHHDALFPGLEDELAELINNKDQLVSFSLIEQHFPVLIFTIQTATAIISEVV